MGRIVEGVFSLPETGEPLANAEFYFVAKRTEATAIVKGVTSMMTTSATGSYSIELETGYYAVSASYTLDNGSIVARRYPLGDIFVEPGDTITLNALLALGNSTADPTSAALQQLLADAQAARDQAVAAEQEAEYWAQQAQNAMATKIDESEKGVADGVATLDGNVKVPLSQIPDSILGQLEYQTVWDASTNTPTLPPTPVQKGQYWITSVAGTFQSVHFEVGDWIVSNDTTYDKVDNTDAVSSVHGRTGNVTSEPGDYNTDQVTEASNLYFTESRVRAVTATETAAGTVEAATSTEAKAGTPGKYPDASKVLEAIRQFGIGVGVNNSTEQTVLFDGRPTGVYRFKSPANGGPDLWGDPSIVARSMGFAVHGSTGDREHLLYFMDGSPIPRIGYASEYDNNGPKQTTPVEFLHTGNTGNAATKNVGTTAGTVAAGDDSRIVGAVQQSAVGPLVLSSPYMTYGGTANAVTLTSTNNYPVTALVTGMQFRFRATAANTGAMTIAVDGLAAVPVKTITGVDTPAEYIRTDVDTVVTFDGTNFVAQREIERGSNTNGRYTRYADGSQVCVARDLTLSISSVAEIAWVFPALFSSGSTNYAYLRASNSNDETSISVLRETSYGTSLTGAGFYALRLDGTRVATSGTVSNFCAIAHGYWYE